jgi:hypothetical protein
MNRNYFTKTIRHVTDVINDIRENGLIQHPSMLSVEEIAEAMKPDYSRPPSESLKDFANRLNKLLQKEEQLKWKQK